MTAEELANNLRRIENSSTNRTIKESACAILSELGFDQWIFAVKSPPSMLGIPATLASGHTSKWMITYMMKGYMHVDPVVAHCRDNDTPLFWDATANWEYAEPKVLAFMDDVRKNGFGSGLALPFHKPNDNPGLLSIVSAKPLEEERERYKAALPHLNQVGQAIQKAIIKTFRGKT